MRNNKDKRGRGTFFPELIPLANAISTLPRADLGNGPRTSKLGAAQRKRERRAAKRLQHEKPSM